MRTLERAGLGFDSRAGVDFGHRPREDAAPLYRHRPQGGPAVRAAIYARMSTENQNERSPDDQVADCRAFATEQGWEAPTDLVFIDRAISGATAARPAYQRMRAALAAGAFDVPLAFDGSRIARNERDFFELLDDLQAAGARAISVSTRQSLDGLSERFQSVISAY